ncbi:DNA polymerase I [Spirochaeta africana]|uniref:DNA polymerase I n=1 Tax=Spirochaeta africana (strain ATCC 700263 / DSM 8902 / Z-7692) TaxID=889378 RepID=H9UMJ8_SPIAZ|nr:DNA polymerase I [Spirochaeta africana]AFG38741.1 DNA polymerase I [Spirochaeta africana DSM 8902]
MNQDSLFILDGYSVIYRSYFAFIRNPLRNSRGQNTSAVFGFARTIMQLFQRYEPGYFAVALDSIGPTFRHDRYPPYKQTRDKTPDDLTAQIPIIEELLEALGVPQIRVEGYEADDVMATCAAVARQRDMSCYVVSGDKDLLQLVEGSVRILKPDKSGLQEMDRAGVFDAWGVYPEQILDYLSLVGDSSDNIPGVKGIGAKTAVALLERFTTLDGIYQHLDQVTSKSQQTKLADGRENAYLSRDLIRLVEDVQLPLELEELRTERLNLSRAVPILLREDIQSLAREMGWSETADTGAVAHPSHADGLVSDRAADATAPSAPGLQGELPLEEVHGPSGEPPQGHVAPDNSPGSYTLVTDMASLEEWIERARKAGVCAIDTETDSLDEMSARLVGFSLSFAAGSGCYCPLSGPNGEVLPQQEALQLLASLTGDTGVVLVLQNAKYDIKVLQNHGVPLSRVGFDTMLAAWVLDAAAGSFGMDALAERLLGYRTTKYGDIVPKGGSFAQVELETAAGYAAEDADITLRLYHQLEPQLRSRKLERIYYDIELPLIQVLAEMEMTGIQVDTGYLAQLSQELEGRLQRITDEIYEIVGYQFNINSTQQLQTVLFTERGLQPRKKTKSGYSTDVSVLQELAKEDPVPDLILQYRRLAKLKSTYVDALPKLVNPATGRIHTHYQQTGTATGRLSSKDPNLQNIPIRDDEGRKIRAAFRPRSGWVFVSADYAQIELVVLAHLSADPGLQRAFREGEDVHRSTGALIFQTAPDRVSAEQRRIAKTINFGVMYGMSAFRLSRELGIPRAEADRFIEAYFATYPGIQQFVAETVQRAEQTGRSTTLLGRERSIPAIHSRNKNEKSGAERIAVNTPIQGTAADIMKLAMLRVAEQLRAQGMQSRLLLQVHDELILECPEQEVDRLRGLLEQEMTGVMELSVPLQVSVENGDSWGAMH